MSYRSHPVYRRRYTGNRNRSLQLSGFYLGLLFVVLGVAVYLFSPWAYVLALALCCVAVFFFAMFGLRLMEKYSILGRFAHVLRYVFWGLFALILLSFFIVQIIISSGAHSDAGAEGADVLIVLGAGLYDDEPSAALSERLDSARTYLERNPGAVVIVSGGQGSRETITEAEAMRRYLEQAGVAPERILKEELSHNTIENLFFSTQIAHAISPELSYVPKVSVLSSEYHLTRVRMIADRAGYDISCVAAPSPNAYSRLAFSVQEYLSLIRAFFVTM